MDTATNSTPPVLTLKNLLAHNSLQEAVKRVETEVAQHPTKADKRWVLFQMLCINGEWARALKQLQVYHKLVSDSDQLVHAMRDLIRSEYHRKAVFEGKQTPGFMVSTAPDWMQLLLQALLANATGDTEQADSLRESAFSLAPNVEGTHANIPFSWLTESDSRLGPVLELVVAGMYRWCPLQDIQHLKVKTPQSLLDLLWLPADLVLKDGTTSKIFVPVRYPNTEQQSEDALRLARHTTWQALGSTAVCGLGQKVLSSEQGDKALFELTEMTFK